MSYKLQFTQKATALIEKIIEYRMLGLHFSRIADIAMTDEEDLQKSSSVNECKNIQGKLHLNNLCFKYAAFEPWVYQNIYFTFKAGESVAGPSGCGKTTLMKNMLGLLEPSVFIDGVDIYQFGLAQYRRLVGL